MYVNRIIIDLQIYIALAAFAHYVDYILYTNTIYMLLCKLLMNRTVFLYIMSFQDTLIEVPCKQSHQQNTKQKPK
jgi:hypothetical protein